MSILERLSQRLIRFLSLDRAIYREIATDPQATHEAALVVALASVLAGLGGLTAAGGSLVGFASRLLTGVAVNWLVWAFVARIAGSVLYGSEASFVRLARVMGYATAPLALGLLAIFTCLRAPAPLLGWAVSVFYGFHALRETAGLRTESALVTIAISSLIVLAVDFLVIALV